MQLSHGKATSRRGLNAQETEDCMELYLSLYLQKCSLQASQVKKHLSSCLCSAFYSPSPHRAQHSLGHGHSGLSQRSLPLPMSPFYLQ